MSRRLVFCGDLACPFDCKVDYGQVKPLFDGAIGIANLEGAILKSREEVTRNKWDDKYSLYSSPAVLDIMSGLNIKYVSLCNNHILDHRQPVEETQRLLAGRGARSWGLKNHDVLRLTLNGRPVYIITFATFSTEHSLNLFNPHKVIACIGELRAKEPDCLIAVFPHWGVDKFFWPEPADRQLAHACVDAGANLIAGHHPHIVQPVEVYKGVSIVYSLGNFILPQTFYGKKKLVYPQKEVQRELIVEWDGTDVKLHRLFFDKELARLLPDADAGAAPLFRPFEGNPGYGRYLRAYLQHASLAGIFLRTRYVAALANEYISFLLRTMLRRVRRMLIRMKLHDPYKASESGITHGGGSREKLLNIRRDDRKSLASKVLFIGISWRVVRGGVAAVENAYSTFVRPFNHVSTVTAGNAFVKLCVAMRALVVFAGWMLLRREIRIVHVHGASDASFWRKRIFINIAKAFGKKVVFHCHGGGFKRFASQHRNAVYKTLKKCDCIVALSESWKEWFEAELHHKYVTVIKNVIPTPEPGKYTRDGSVFTLFFLGKLCRQKGIYDLLDVLADNKERYEGRLRLVIGGNGETERVKKTIAERGLAAVASCEGWIAGEDKMRLLCTSDAYVLPSYAEGLPVSILEAMSYGLPVISTTIGGIPEILADGVNGFIIAPGDKDSLRRAVDALMNDTKLRERMGRRSLQIVQPYLPECVAGQLAGLYNKMLEK